MPEGIREALLIYNPRAGRTGAGFSARLDRARAILARDGIVTEVAPTDGPGAATDIARRAVIEGRQMVIASGGDGTLNEVANGLAGSRVPLAVLPAGTANVLAKELELPWDVEKAAALIAPSRLRRIGLGLVSFQGPPRVERYFLSVAGAGPDGAITYAVSGVLKARSGIFAYWLEGFRQLAIYKFPRFRAIHAPNSVQRESGAQPLHATLIVVGRTKHYGGPFRITTEADLYGDDFELMLCTTGSRARYLAYLPLLSLGLLRRARHAHFVRAASVVCEPVDATDVHVQVDGEPAGRLPAEFRVVLDALTLAVPDLRKSTS
jgi:diacylglycerol kinase (ATP)